jgi:hypothetical protein
MATREDVLKALQNPSLFNELIEGLPESEKLQGYHWYARQQGIESPTPADITFIKDQLTKGKTPERGDVEEHFTGPQYLYGAAATLNPFVTAAAGLTGQFTGSPLAESAVGLASPGAALLSKLPWLRSLPFVGKTATQLSQLERVTSPPTWIQRGMSRVSDSGSSWLSGMRKAAPEAPPQSPPSGKFGSATPEPEPPIGGGYKPSDDPLIYGSTLPGHGEPDLNIPSIPWRGTRTDVERRLGIDPLTRASTRIQELGMSSRIGDQPAAKAAELGSMDAEAKRRIQGIQNPGSYKTD